MNRDEMIKEYVNDRNAAVKTMNVEAFKAFIRKYMNTGDMPPMPSDDVLEITMRKMAVHSKGLDVDTRVEAFRWLLERGYDFSMGA